MQSLRRSTLLARLVLAWFLLAVGVAIASPIVQPQAMEMVCTAGGGVKLVALDSDATDATAAHHTLDCPMCQAATVPPAMQRASSVPPQPLAHALQPIAVAHIAALAGAPLPPRGPPFPV